MDQLLTAAHAGWWLGWNLEAPNTARSIITQLQPEAPWVLQWAAGDGAAAVRGSAAEAAGAELPRRMGQRYRAVHREAQAAVRCRQRGGGTGTRCYHRPPARSRARTPHRLGVCCRCFSEPSSVRLAMPHYESVGKVLVSALILILQLKLYQTGPTSENLVPRRPGLAGAPPRNTRPQRQRGRNRVPEFNVPFVPGGNARIFDPRALLWNQEASRDGIREYTKKLNGKHADSEVQFKTEFSRCQAT
uniref:Uncharacterized protein n=1 Tax=Oryza glumipatula TaxID=40148 RepID=A0A0D9YFR6_9ORYZ